MGSKANVRRRLAMGVAGALLASSLVLGIAPVAADDGQDAQDNRIQRGGEDQQREDQQREDPQRSDDTHLSITSVTLVPAASSDAVAAPSSNNGWYVEDLNDKT